MKPANVAAYLVLGMVAFFVLTAIVWLIYPVRPWALNQPISIISPVVHRGGVVVFEMDYCKHVAVAAIDSEVHYAFLDSVVYSIPGTTSQMLQSGCHVIREAVAVPMVLPPGTYRLEMIRFLPVNPLRMMQIASISGNFQVE